ncbi:AMP-binding protein [Polymorphobacter fuscus]|uniref:AMP-binding protein n=1 Tax=Sandarakinorhabdus fusca TaxID=1439888 RepID=A0A7C9GRH7_9SPHN|nr:AMP-binding protein [Polymorphobacter fuscus]KAB7643872.1 AMP-binding protein [Polymorphobacter fuscus]MQT18573.1 AMP-binding protein [Polymorphobacter fuscus]NJC07060.1 malonyl-CoA/methylmalonyl-CoA synthetase [Polymorphobacter fuscus]
MTAGFYHRLDASLRGNADRTLLTFGDAALTGAELVDAVARRAAVLVAAGVAPGDRVMVQAEKSLELVLLYLATLRIGGVYVPLNTGYRAAEIAYFIGDAAPRLLVCDPADAAAHGAQVSAAGGILMTLDGGGRGSFADAVTADRAPAAARNADDLAAIVYTSGTTGRSKGAMITHGNLLANAHALIATWQITDDDTLLHALPLYHIHGLFIALNTLLLAGGRVDMLAGFDVDRVLGRLGTATLFMGVPTYYTRLLADPRLTPALAAPVRLFICGSAPLTPQIFETFEARTGHAIVERYGMSECGIICSNPVDGPRIAGSVGRPLPGTDVRIADGADTGVLEVRGPSVFAGYWRQPEKTAAEFRDDGFFTTGDIATIDADGSVRIVGREKDMIICGGLNVYPKEIEERIDALPGVAEAAVIGVPHPDFGEAVCAVVRPTGDIPLAPDAIVAALRGDLAGFKLPKAVFIVDELPRNAMAKVQKAVLRARYAGHFTG